MTPQPRRDHTGRHPSDPHAGRAGPEPSRSDPSGPAVPRRFRARSPEDLLAFVPLALGFVPQDSVVVVALGRSGPQARIDLPQDVDQAHVLGRALARTCRRHGVERVVVIGYAADPARHAEVVLAVAEAMAVRSLTVVDVLGASPSHWIGLNDPVPDPRPYDADCHAFRAEAVMAGLVVHASRAEVAARLDPDPEEVARTVVALQSPVGPEDPVAPTESEPGGERWAGWYRELTSEDAPLPASRRAELLESLGHADVLHRVCFDVDRRDASRHLEHWIRILRSTPENRVPSVAGVVAYLAWLSGNGALAWCAVDRAVAALGGAGAVDELAVPLVDMVQALLLEAVSPGNAVDTPKSA